MSCMVFFLFQKLRLTYESVNWHASYIKREKLKNQANTQCAS